MELNKFSYGTASLGIEGYGLSPQPFKEDPLDFLNYLYGAGIYSFDTAASYGNSETIIGDAHQKYNWKLCNTEIDTKINGLVAGSDNNVEVLRSSLLKSLERLRIDSINILYLHQNDKAISCDAKIISELIRLKQSGYIKYIGASLYSKCELKSVAETAAYDWVQIPANIFDCSFIDMAEKFKNIKFAVRSVFMQGALFCDRGVLLSLPNGAGLVAMRDLYLEICEDYKITLTTLAIEFLINKLNVGKIIIGSRNRNIWSDVLTRSTKIPEEVFIRINNLACTEKVWTNPRQW